MALVIGGLSLVATPANVKAEMTQNEFYRELVAKQSGYKGQRSDFLFDVADVDGDGSVDLIMSYYDTFDGESGCVGNYVKYITGAPDCIMYS